MVPILFTRLLKQYKHIDQSITRWMAKYGIFLLRISIGLIFVWFGALKVIENFKLTFGICLAYPGLKIVR